MTTQTATSAATTHSVQASRCGSMMSISSAMSVTSLNGLNLGDRVAVKSTRKLISLRRSKAKTGIVRFLGDTQFAVGQWVGIELDEAAGHNDGSVDGMRYFQCRPNHGIFAPVHKVTHSANNARGQPKDKEMVCPVDESHLHNLKNANDADNVLQTQIRLLEAAADLRNAENRQLKGQLEETSRIADELREKYRVCNERCTSSMAEIEGFEEALRQANEGRRQQEIKMESAKELAHQLQTHIEELQLQAADKDVQLRQLNQEKSAVQAELGQLSESCKEAGQSRFDLENEVSTARETIVDLQSVIMKMEQEQTELHTQTARLDELTSSLKSEAESKDQLIANFIRDQQHCDMELEELKQQENILLLSIQQLETDQTKSKEQVESLRETVSALEAEKVQWKDGRLKLLETAEDLKCQLIEAATLKEEYNQRSIEVETLRTLLEDERFRSDELRVALEASELQCRQMAERNYQLLADNHKYIDEVNKVQVEKMRQMEQEKAEAVQLAVDIRDQLKDLRERLAEKEQKCDEEDDEKNHKVAHLEQSLVNTEKDLHQLRVEVDSLKKKAYGSSHSRNSGGVTVRNHHYNSHLWRHYLIFSAIRHSRLYRRHW